METNIPAGSPQAVQRWSAMLAIQVVRNSYFQKFTSTKENSIVQEIVDLKSGAGDRIKFDLSLSLRGTPISGDNKAEGKGKKLEFLQNEIVVDQARFPVDIGGRMTNKRTLHNLRDVGKNRGAEWAANWIDDLMFVYASGDVGAGGINETSDVDGAWGENPITAPTERHIVYAGPGKTKSALTAADVMEVDVIDRAVNRAKMMRARNSEAVAMQPVKVDGQDHYVAVINPDQYYDMRSGTGPNSWLELQKHAGPRDMKNPIFSGSKGMINGTIIHEHERIRRFDDYGAGGNVSAARALFLGRQALLVAYGTTDGGASRMFWKEETSDFGNALEVACGCIFGVKKGRYGDNDVGVIAMDTASKDPMAA